MREVLGEIQNTDGLGTLPKTAQALIKPDCSLAAHEETENQQQQHQQQQHQPYSPVAHHTPRSSASTPFGQSPAYHTTTSFPESPPYDTSPRSERAHPLKSSGGRGRLPPVRYRLQDNAIAAMDSPPDSPAQSTLRFNEGMTRAIDALQYEASSRKSSVNYGNQTALNEDMSTIHEHDQPRTAADDGDTTMGFDSNRTINEGETMGDLSTFSAIPADMTRYGNARDSPTTSRTIPPDGRTPKANRNSIAMSTPATGQRPLHLLTRRSTDANGDDNDATPRMGHGNRIPESPADLLNFTGQTNVHIPPPGPTPRTSRRSPSGRGAFPIRVNPTPSHRSQASVDRERASGRSPQKPFPDQQQSVPATPASGRSSTNSINGFGMDLLDIDLAPMATPRSIPTVTPRELENLRSELQSRISGLEATLAGKEAEVQALKKSITDAEIRAGKSGEELLVERAEKEHLAAQRDELDRQAREMENVLREVKQNAFVEEREREKLRRQAEEADRRTEECEVKILELNASLETLRSDRLRSHSSSPASASGEPRTPGGLGSIDVDAAVKNATETVARELHALYKSKHERKVGDLKLSYEKRWQKQVDALKAELKQSNDQVARLMNDHDSNLTESVVPGQAEAMSKMEGQIEELRRWNEDLSAQKKVVEAEMAGTRSELETVRRENETIRADLETERIEKGDLVAQVEVFLTVSAEQEREREVEREAREARERERQPVSPPRSDASGDSSSTVSSATANAQVQSPNKTKTPGGVRPRPMSMLAKPTATKFGSGIPAPGQSGLKQPGSRPGSLYQRGSLMDGITRMGATSR